MQYDMEISQIVDYILCDPLAGFLDSWLSQLNGLLTSVCLTSSLYAVKDFLKKNNIPFTVMINNVQVSLFMESIHKITLLAFVQFDFFQ